MTAHDTPPPPTADTPPAEPTAPVVNHAALADEPLETIELVTPKPKPVADTFTIPRVVVNYAIIALVFFGVGLVLGGMFLGEQLGNGPAFDERLRTIVAEAVQQELAAAGPTAVPTPDANTVYDIDIEGDPFIGPEDAPVVMVEFSDFTCPYCGRFSTETKPQILAAYGDQIRFVYRDLPILSPTSYRAALGAECADDQGQFWAYHDLLFANRSALAAGDTALFQFAAQLQLDAAAFRQCMESEAHRAEIVQDFDDAQALGQMGTPSFFINGRFISGALPFEAFATIIDEELAEAGAA